MLQSKGLVAVRTAVGTVATVQQEVSGQAVLVRERLAAVRARMRTLT